MKYSTHFVTTGYLWKKVRFERVDIEVNDVFIASRLNKAKTLANEFDIAELEPLSFNHEDWERGSGDLHDFVEMALRLRSGRQLKLSLCPGGNQTGNPTPVLRIG